MRGQSKDANIFWKKDDFDIILTVEEADLNTSELRKIPVFSFDMYFDNSDNVASNIMRASSNNMVIVLK